MGIARVDINGDKKMDLVSWKMECMGSSCKPTEIQVKIATLKGNNKFGLTPIEELNSLTYGKIQFSLGQAVKKRHKDIERVIYAFGFRLCESSTLAESGSLWGLELFMRVKPSVDEPNRKNSIRKLGNPLFHPSLFRMNVNM